MKPDKSQSKNGQPDFFEFDKYRLDEEWEGHQRLFWNHAVDLADKRAQEKRAEANMKVVYAEVELEYRRKHVDDEPKEGEVKSSVLISERYRAAVEAHIQAGHDADIAKAAVDTLHQRKTALEKDTELFLAGYFAKPRAPKATEDQLDMLHKRTVRNKGRR